MKKNKVIYAQEKLLNEKEVAQILGLSVRTLQGFRSTGGASYGSGPPYIKLSGTSGSIRFRRKDLDAWLDKQLVT